MSIAKKAVKEAEDVARLAVEAAKQDVIERMAPEIKKIVEQSLRGGKRVESIDRIRRMQDGHGETEFEEGIQMKPKDDELDLESIEGMFPSLAESEEDLEEAKDEEEVTESDEFAAVAEEFPALDEGGFEDGDMDEEIEISEAELASFFKEGLKLEAQVSKGFKDMSPSGEEIDPKAGLADVKNGEHAWEDEEPPAKQDWTVKESVRDLIKKGLAENKALKAENARLKKISGALYGRLSESNLFNAKVVCINKFMNKHRLTTEQKKMVIKCIDEAKSINEAKRLYVVLETSMKTVGSLTEGKRPAKVGASQKRGDANPKVLRESAGGGESNKFSRMQQLAGLIKG